MNRTKKIALAVVIISISVGSIFGLLVQSSSSPNTRILFTASASYLSNGFVCSPILGNYSEWLQIGVNGNRTNLNLDTVTVIDPSTRITLTMPLNATAFASYKPFNATYETISIPLPNYWSPNVNLDVSLSYYFSGFAPIAFTIGLTPIFQKQSINC